jgi:ATP-binding cassette subfamily F protein 3
MGYFAQQSLDCSTRPHVWEQIEKDFPHESTGALRNLLGAFQFSATTSRSRFARCRAARRPAWCWRACCSTRRTSWCLDEPTNHLDPRDQGDAGRLTQRVRGTMMFVSHDRMFLRGLSNRVLELGR